MGPRRPLRIEEVLCSLGKAQCIFCGHRQMGKINTKDLPYLFVRPGVLPAWSWPLPGSHRVDRVDPKPPCNWTKVGHKPQSRPLRWKGSPEAGRKGSQINQSFQEKAFPGWRKATPTHQLHVWVANIWGVDVPKHLFHSHWGKANRNAAETWLKVSDVVQLLKALESSLCRLLLLWGIKNPLLQHSQLVLW